MYSLFKKKETVLSSSNQKLIQDYYSLKQSLELPLKIKLLFEMLENYSEEKSDKNKLPKDFQEQYKTFCKCFQKLPFEEKYYFMLALLKIVKSLLAQYSKKTQEKMKEKNEIEGQELLSYTSSIEKIETTCSIKNNFMGLSKWDGKYFKFCNEEKVLKIYSQNKTKKQVIFHLANYFVRSSTKQKHTIVMEAVFNLNKIPEKYQTYYIYLKNREIYSEIYSNMKKSIIMTWKKRLLSMFNESEQKILIQKGQNFKIQQENIPKLLSHAAVSEYLKTKKKIQEKIQQRTLRLKPFYELNNLKIQRSKKYKNFYKVENVIPGNIQTIVKKVQLLNGVLNGQQCKNGKLVHLQTMEQFSPTISAMYYKYIVKGNTQQMLSLVEKEITPSKVKVCYKAIDSFMLQKNIQLLMIKAQKQVQDKVRLSVYGFLKFNQENKKLNTISVIDFLLSIVEFPEQKYNENKTNNIKNIQFNKTISFSTDTVSVQKGLDNFIPDDEQKASQQESNEDEFQTVVGDDFDQQERELEICNTFQDLGNQNQQGSISEDDQLERTVVNEFRTEKSFRSENSHTENVKLIKKTSLEKPNNYLINKATFYPKNKTNKSQSLLIPEHFFTGEWGKYEKGGVFSLNIEALDKQKQVFKSLLTRMGNALFKKKSANFSLPVIIFKPQSQLETIARDITYAPLLLQNLQKATALQRMKRGIVTMISMGTIGLSLQKPFNPLLGQTYQAYIDDCPIYMEQTQHHPAVSTLFFQGRGYSISGSIIPSISIRLNSVKCFSEAPIRIRFDFNQETIQFTPGKMLMGGFLVGDRTFDFTDTTYVIDWKNRIIGEVNFGPKKKFTKNMIGDKNDFVWGYIYKVSSAFLAKFKKEKQKISPSSDKESEVLAKLYGCWHQKIYIEDQVIFDFETQLPYALVREKYPLMSDCSRRKDIKYLQENDLQKAQDEKDLVENVQRQDAKLRKKHQG